MSLHPLDEQLFESYGLSSQALRHLALREQTEAWHRSKSIHIGQELAILHLNAFDGHLEPEATDFLELFALDDGVGLLFTVSNDPAVGTLKPFDYAGWKRILSKEHPGMRVVNEAKAAAEMRNIRVRP